MPLLSDYRVICSAPRTISLRGLHNSRVEEDEASSFVVNLPPNVQCGENDEMVLVGGGHVAEPGPDGTVVGYTGTWLFDCESGEWRKLNSKKERSISELFS